MTEQRLVQIQSASFQEKSVQELVAELVAEVARQADQITNLQRANTEEVERRRKAEGEPRVPMLAIREWQDMNHAAHVDGAKAIHRTQAVDVLVTFPDNLNPPERTDLNYCVFGDWKLIRRVEP